MAVDVDETVGHGPRGAGCMLLRPMLLSPIVLIIIKIIIKIITIIIMINRFRIMIIIAIIIIRNYN